MRRAIACLVLLALVGSAFPPGGPLAPRLALAASSTTVSMAPILAQPDPGSKPVLIVDAGTAVSIDGAPENGFYPVSVNGVSGWIPGDLLATPPGGDGAAETPTSSTSGAAGGSNETSGPSPQSERKRSKDEAETPEAAAPAEASPAATEPPAARADVAPAATDPTAAPTVAAVEPTASATAPPAAEEAAVAAAEPDPAEPSPAATEAALAATSAPATEPAPASEASVAATEATAAPTFAPTAAATAVATFGPTAPAGTEEATRRQGRGADRAAATTATASVERFTAQQEAATPTPVPTVAAPAAASPSAAAPSSTAAPTAVPTRTPAAPATSTPAPTAVPTPVTLTGASGPATVSTNATLWSEPRSGSGVVFSVPAGSTVERTGGQQNGFVSATYMWMDGWIAEDVLEPTSAVATEVPTATPPPNLDVRTPRPGSGVAYTTVDLSLRDGPSANDGVVATVPAGSRVVLTGVMENDFQRVTYEGQVGWIANDFLSTPRDPDPAADPHDDHQTYSHDQIVKIIYAAADQYGQSRQAMLRVATCESNLDPYAVNPSGSYGLFQFIRSTWKSTPYGGQDIFDPRANANAAGWMWQQGRASEWVCK